MNQLDVLIAVGDAGREGPLPEPVSEGGLRFVHLFWTEIETRLRSARPLAVGSTTSLWSWQANRIQRDCEATRTPHLFIDTPDLAGATQPTLAALVQSVWLAALDGTATRSSGRPLLSVFTPTNGPATFLLRAYRSLRRQTYDNWEWVLIEDTDDACSTTREMVHQLSRADHRVRAVSSTRRTGRIGQLKKYVADLCGGDVLLELDHDDELTSTALWHMATASLQFPECGMFYTDWAELVDGVDAQWYGTTFAFGFGRYVDRNVDGAKRLVAVSPELNGHTVRHIVSMPNHLRAWRTDFYRSIGGHNPNLPTADDYELTLRSFLAARIVHLHHCSYIQHFRSDFSNTQFTRNPSIHSAVKAIAESYENDIRRRLGDLNLRDSRLVGADSGDTRPIKANLDYHPIGVA
jgi:glycosyltransferase involved in cell wall biosynthesis